MLEAAEKIVWHQVSNSLELQAGILVAIPEFPDLRQCIAVSSHVIPTAPLNGAESDALGNVVGECYKVGTFHEHAIGNWALGNILPRLATGLQKSTLAVFAPIAIEGSHYCLLGFPKHNTRHNRKESAIGSAKALAEIAACRHSFAQIRERLSGIELYTKEVGHDFAGSIHAVLGKLTYIEEGNLTDAGMKRKANEAATEVRNAYAVAEGLGVAVDPDYAIGSSASFRVADLLAEIAREYEAEAKEKNIVIRVGEVKGAQIYGDKLPFKLAIANLVKNAIKYSHNDTDVFLGIRSETDRLVIMVQNKGIGLPTGDERKRIWDFGYRSERAKKLNVNGSGIGLHSCKKIVVAHGGQVWDEDYKDGTTFYATVPKNRIR